MLAASLAADGFAGPRTVLEGEFGFLKVFCTRWDLAELTRGLGEEFVVSSTVLKRYPCHATAHAAVRAVRDLQAEHGFTGAEVEAITVTGTQRMVERHNILEPADLMLAQYSIPFSVALALCREARDPESWDETALADPQIRALCRRVRLVPEPAGEHGGMASTVTITLADGRRLERRSRERHARSRRARRQIPAPDPRSARREPAQGALRAAAAAGGRKKSLDWLT